ncbi:Transcription initiation protein spt3 [Serendipita sp. 396]|nr:Transcription initiation protein spt3 [Serendipita sp. 396]KAG8787855.1 Transcription initiation protein spt3 [Serendipita sp. 397]KAG8803131.1 Transcription initiation protein spt3 [Serendipita sp. 398]KAG8807643.1 Transcription initiation protein spt3 [Serendipita sp. 400]KAG8824965.1 Transcription initiation protein spt3 [Serendipita sp. 401]KAG8841630.1 Transcription initiation protein spt3 [Serendipita sp. 411]KAG8873621.1 Transcription initiation protein spt3 [Serendipita sp. 405]KA
MSKRKLAALQDGNEPKYYYSTEIGNMLYVFGEVLEPNPETVNLVEEIVREQVVEIVTQAKAHAVRRGQRNFKAEDLVFILRHDKDKVNRLRTYLSWKDVRKHAKDTDGAGADDVELGDDEKPDEGIAQQMNVKLPWELRTVYLGALWDNGLIEDDEEDEEMTEARQERLRDLDEATREMTKDEYLRYSDMRQASFTHRKAARFKEFLNLPSHMQIKSGDDTMDILGFLAFEIVRALCTDALQLKRSAELSGFGGTASEPDAKRPRRSEFDSDAPVCTLFLPPAEPRTALKPDHIRAAFAAMQRRGRQKSKMLNNFRGGFIKSDVVLI